MDANPHAKPYTHTDMDVDTDVDANPHTESYTHTDLDANNDVDANPHTKPYTHTNMDADTDVDTNPHAKPYTDTDVDADIHAYTNRDTNSHGRAPHPHRHHPTANLLALPATGTQIRENQNVRSRRFIAVYGR